MHAVQQGAHSPADRQGSSLTAATAVAAFPASSAGGGDSQFKLTPSPLTSLPSCCSLSCATLRATRRRRGRRWPPSPGACCCPSPPPGPSSSPTSATTGAPSSCSHGCPPTTTRCRGRGVGRRAAQCGARLLPWMQAVTAQPQAPAKALQSLCAHPSFLLVSPQVLGLDLRSSGFYSVLPWVTMAVSGAVGTAAGLLMCRFGSIGSHLHLHPHWPQPAHRLTHTRWLSLCRWLPTWAAGLPTPWWSAAGA